MPRKTKEQEQIENEEKNVKSVAKTTKRTSTTSAKKSTSSVARKTSTKNSSKVVEETKPKSKSAKSATSKSASTKKTANSAKTSKTSKAKDVSSSTKKSTTAKSTKATTKTATKKQAKSTTKSTKTVETAKTKKELSKGYELKQSDIVEYYDLPYRYNQTVVKVLAQTPTNLFIYWDISDQDRENLKKEYGENFFENSKPVLIVYNDTLHYNFEVEINDFANSWYLHVADSKCDYRIELGRRPIIKNEKLNRDYIYISTSNEIESPNDRVLFNKEQKMVYFKNVKTGQVSSKPLTSLSFIRNMGKIYNIYDIYKAMYNDENIEEIYDLSNPSSGNPTSRKSFF